eukprot:CAMPEP_0204835658 /NCGR_PEP_ID=MMETSP1346-20131115/23233_1 /ASSEMBLY_ACC=CAM_ASM_000771 /TAXON_ID=215587 /ORGANISM="Aplanochytrium stocchinoi, Strain GSBS06" /LENGTH=64 /DNA_ID=CAMNT_0051969853 /DNA_START=124 /DNA_END=314 /DNA_ORIENTATION=+
MVNSSARFLAPTEASKARTTATSSIRSSSLSESESISEQLSIYSIASSKPLPSNGSSNIESVMT